MSSNKVSAFIPRVVRSVPDPLGLYIRPEHRDQKVLLNKQLMPVTDRVLKASNIDWKDNDLLGNKIKNQRKRLDATRIALGEYAENNPPKSCSQHPLTRMAKEATR